MSIAFGILVLLESVAILSRDNIYKDIHISGTVKITLFKDISGIPESLLVLNGNVVSTSKQVPNLILEKGLVTRTI